jgi:hypothetical protein
VSYFIVEKTDDGLITYRKDTAEMALSLWYALDGEVHSIMNEERQAISLDDLKVAAQNEKNSNTKNS